MKLFKLMVLNYIYNKQIFFNVECRVITTREKKYLMEFFNQSHNEIKKIQWEDSYSRSVNAKINDVLCFTNRKNVKVYRLVV
jgi:DNA-directed RNA polymerase subunit H (RpoH/RPB5)